MRATVGCKRPRFIYTKRPRMSINISVNSTIFQQFAAEPVVCQPFFPPPSPGPTSAPAPLPAPPLILVDVDARLPVRADPAAVHPRRVEGRGEVAAPVQGD